ncbi:thioredoxin domain-containing protein [Rhodococcus phenolicus]|uniref:thioredoxin domain-containing protein n=1 Tax=Rhodococcus phenolicus TaxID=263849 RepID=UPI00083455E7|nr:thioredoxin domain-containing protein [Rhodococcus phenolicus]
MAANRLRHSTSPYLQQHAGNPVHWREWNDEALAEARERDVPILLSIGYAACHWCHVMAHESFEDDATAAVMNENFVCIKVDREERPDLDAVYMNATVATTGHGGWPMTCFLTADGAPFYCGTYYPKVARSGVPSFTELLHAITHTWRTRRDDVARAAGAVVDELQRSSAGLPAGARAVDAALLDVAAAAVAADEDRTHGGFGGAPKFPPSALLEGLLRSHERSGSAVTLAVVERTADAMARGGIHDRLAGGFARYSVDAAWVVPHFEKMLYDNALLLRVYAHLARITGSDATRRIAEDTVGFLLRDLSTAEGCFASALDADTAGVEGLTYVWTPAQLIEVLGPADGAWAAQLFEVTDTGTFEDGASVLQLPSDPDDAERAEHVRARLFEARRSRPQPGRDDKVVTAWNAFAVTALAEAGAAFGRADWIEAAATCARRLLDLHLVDGRLRRASLGGVVGLPAGVLEDHGALVTALLALYQATGDASWIGPARELADTALDRFADPQRTGSWFDTADDAETLVARPRDPIDGATPSGAALVTEALLTLSAVVEDGGRYRDAADAALGTAAVLLERAPRSAGHWLTVAEAAVSGPIQVAVVGGGELLGVARRKAPGGSLVVGGAPGSSPLFAGRDLVAGSPAAYVCRGFVCDLPVTSADNLVEALTAS